MKFNKIAVSLAMATITSFASSYALADPVSITLGNGYGAGPGGEFKAIVTGTYDPFQGPSVLYGVNTDFITFCLEKSESFDSYGQTLYVKGVNTGAKNGGAGGAVPDPNGGVWDPISSQTAYLYTQFSKGTLSNYDYADATAAQKALRAADADALQNAFWYLENELGSTQFSSLSAQTQAWINEANNKIASNHWSGIGDVRVLNLYKDQNFQQISQDQLYMAVPEPETYAMLLAGLGLIGFVAKRRRRSLR